VQVFYRSVEANTAFKIVKQNEQGEDGHDKNGLNGPAEKIRLPLRQQNKKPQNIERP
jgi:hypothetical protein